MDDDPKEVTWAFAIVVFLAFVMLTEHMSKKYINDLFPVRIDNP